MDTVNVQQQGSDRLSSSNLYVIVPRSNFSCDGRITGYMASLNQINNDDDDENSCNNPRIIVWQPLNTERTMFSFRNRYTLSNSDITRVEDYYFADVSFTGDDRIEFQSGDVIGYQHRSSPCYTIWNIRTAGYVSYSIGVILGSINIDGSFTTATTDRQPLIQVIFGMEYITV